MRFDERFLDEIKSRVRLSEVIGRSVKLRRQGREWVGLSPFTKERTPSFFVNDDKGFFHDFSSGKHGDLIAFLQEAERLTFIEAVERLAAEAGVPLPMPDPASEARARARASLADWLEAAAQFFEAELRRPAAEAARAHLADRGLAEVEWKRFRLGYARADRTHLKDHLVAKGALADELLEAGLLARPEGAQTAVDRFRDRIIFPIADPRGRIVSFGARALDPAARAKYLNGPETPLFDKGRTLYGLTEARRLLAEEGSRPIVVEGYFDVIACQRAGLPAVAAMGTSLTESQMEILWRLSPEPILCFDADRAGDAAASRAIDRALPLLTPTRSFAFVMLEGGKDPDEILREKGSAALRAQLAASRPLVEALFARERDRERLDTPERKTGLRARLRAAAGQIADKELRAAYAEALLALHSQLLAPPTPRPAAADSRRRFDGEGRASPLGASREGRAAAKRLARALDPLAAALARGALDDPALIDEVLEALPQGGFGDPHLEALARELVAARLGNPRLDSAGVRNHLRERGFSALLFDIDRAAELSRAPFLREDVDSAAAGSQWSHAFAAQRRAAALDDALASAKAEMAKGQSAAALAGLKKERDALRRAIKSGTIWTSRGPD